MYATFLLQESRCEKMEEIKNAYFYTHFYRFHPNMIHKVFIKSQKTVMQICHDIYNKKQ